MRYICYKVLYLLKLFTDEEGCYPSRFYPVSKKTTNQLTTFFFANVEKQICFRQHSLLLSDSNTVHHTSIVFTCYLSFISKERMELLVGDLTYEMGITGVEPVWGYPRKILSLVCIPIPSYPLMTGSFISLPSHMPFSRKIWQPLILFLTFYCHH